MSGDASAGTLTFVPFQREIAGEKEQERADGNHGPARDGVAVLLIDGCDAQTREIVAALSECEDPKVTVNHVSDPKEAEHLWLQGHHDLVMVDVWLGTGISVELVTLLTSSPCTCPIVMLSSLSSEELKAYFVDSDLYIHSKRNISPRALAQTLWAALSSEDA